MYTVSVNKIIEEWEKRVFQREQRRRQQGEMYGTGLKGIIGQTFRKKTDSKYARKIT
jgi:hypothetical protein